MQIKEINNNDFYRKMYKKRKLFSSSNKQSNVPAQENSTEWYRSVLMYIFGVAEICFRNCWNNLWGKKQQNASIK